MKYNKKADKYLKEFYHSLGSRSWKQKLNALELRLGIVPGSQCYSHEPTDQQKVGMMEYELLERMNLIELVLA